MNFSAARRLRRFAFSAKNVESRRVHSYAEVPPKVYKIKFYEESTFSSRYW